ncbi:hypothetical protein ACJX0J_011183, partial [Zea mays]
MSDAFAQAVQLEKTNDKENKPRIEDADAADNAPAAPVKIEEDMDERIRPGKKRKILFSISPDQILHLSEVWTHDKYTQLRFHGVHFNSLHAPASSQLHPGSFYNFRHINLHSYAAKQVNKAKKVVPLILELQAA